MRTRLVALLTAGAMTAAACGGASGTEASTATTSPPASSVETDASDADESDIGSQAGSEDPEQTVARIPRVLFAGDSLMQEIHATMAAALGDSAETRFLLSPRLIRNEAQKLIWQNTLDDFRPDAVVVIFSHWERLVIGAQTAEDINDVDAYAGLVAVPFVEFVADNGADLVWLSAPPVREARVNAVYAVMNEAFRSATAETAGARFVELAPALNDGSGAYADVLADAAGGVARARNIDGVHLCPAGAVRVVEAALGPLAQVTDATPVAEWQSGTWRDEAPFDKPDECPTV